MAKVTLTKSPIGSRKNQKDSLKALKLNKMHQTVEVDLTNPSKAGLVNTVRHLVTIEE